MATVYLAYDLKHERKVAVKVLRPELAAVIGAARFLREIKTIATLHICIFGLIDSGEVDGTAYYVMPYVEGESLRDRLRRETQLPVRTRSRSRGKYAESARLCARHGMSIAHPHPSTSARDGTRWSPTSALRAPSVARRRRR